MIRSDNQKLIDLMYEIAMTAYESHKYNQNNTNKDIAAWVSKALLDSGFPTKPMGMCWGVLTKENKVEATMKNDVDSNIIDDSNVIDNVLKQTVTKYDLRVSVGEYSFPIIVEQVVYLSYRNRHSRYYWSAYSDSFYSPIHSVNDADYVSGYDTLQEAVDAAKKAVILNLQEQLNKIANTDTVYTNTAIKPIMTNS